MKHTSRGYTLLESLIVLGLVAGMLFIGTTVNAPKVSVTRWTDSFDARWQQVRLTAQTRQQVAVVDFQATGISFNGQKLAYPRGYLNQKPQKIRILATGYVAPTTIVLTQQMHTIKIIFSLGGGAYRMVQT